MPIVPEQPQDQLFMNQALRYAGLGLGETWPNPAVGCLIIDNRSTLYISRTARTGRPHAEERALLKAGSKAFGATLYVTLEPCAHTSQRLSCAEAIIRAGIKRVVIATIDPDPRTNGRGINKLLQAGLSVTTPCLEELAKKYQAGFLSIQKRQRPWITLKMAASLDGKIADDTGNGRWITNEHSRKRSHVLRAFHDAILVGIGTVLKDDPLLNCRLKRFRDRLALRIVLDSHLRIPLNSQLVQTASQYPTWIICLSGQDPLKSQQLTEKGAVVWPHGDLSIPRLVRFLAEQGLTRVLVEGGGTLNTAFLKEKMVDQLIVFRAPIFLGEQGISMTKSLSPVSIHHPYRFQRLKITNLSGDIFEQYQMISAPDLDKVVD